MKPKRKPVITAICTIAVAYLSLCGYRFARAERYWLFDRACAGGDASRVALLLRLGADPNGVWDTRYYVDYNWTVFEPTPPLFVAASGGHAEVVRLLLASGANPKIQGIEGLTPREAAQIGGHIEVVRLIDNAQRK